MQDRQHTRWNAKPCMPARGPHSSLLSVTDVLAPLRIRLPSCSSSVTALKPCSTLYLQRSLALPKTTRECNSVLEFRNEKNQAAPCAHDHEPKSAWQEKRREGLHRAGPQRSRQSPGSSSTDATRALGAEARALQQGAADGL